MLPYLRVRLTDVVHDAKCAPEADHKVHNVQLVPAVSAANMYTWQNAEDPKGELDCRRQGVSNRKIRTELLSGKVGGRWTQGH